MNSGFVLKSCNNSNGHILPWTNMHFSLNICCNSELHLLANDFRKCSKICNKTGNISYISFHENGKLSCWTSIYFKRLCPVGLSPNKCGLKDLINKFQLIQCNEQKKANIWILWNWNGKVCRAIRLGLKDHQQPNSHSIFSKVWNIGSSCYRFYTLHQTKYCPGTLN